MHKKKTIFFGKILRLHGLKGDWIVQLNSIIELHNSLKIKFLYIDIDGIQVPYYIDNIKIISPSRILIRFLKTTLQENFRNSSLYISLQDISSTFDLLFYDSTIIGFCVQDLHKGFIGTLLEINISSPQKRFDIRWENKQIWIPIVKEFFVELRYTERILLLNCPAGLLDLYL